MKTAILLGFALVASMLAGCAGTNSTTTTTPTTSTAVSSTPTSSTPMTMTPTTPTTPGVNATPVTDAWYNATQTPPGPNTTYAFDGPSTLNPGWVTFHLANKGMEPHQLVLIKLPPGVTFAQHAAMMNATGTNATGNPTNHNDTMGMGANATAKDIYVGGIGNVLPGAVANATVHLTPGTYVIECQIPGPAGVHAMHGMMKELTVAGADNGAAPPTSDVTLSLFNYGFAWSTPPTAGRHVIKVVNNGTMDHEAPMERLVGNKTMQDFLAWAQNPQGAPPVDQSLGAAGISPGQIEYVDVDFAAGHSYGAACFFPDENGVPHFVHGMITQWTV
jgi:uncharacterized cupredoxin-like copper-binding protein